jgi:hypothetical protein
MLDDAADNADNLCRRAGHEDVSATTPLTLLPEG